MTGYTIGADDASVTIEINGVEGRQDELLEAFGECQQGRCSCPTNEYEKVEAMEVSSTEDRIAIRLAAKSGTSFETAEIEACLDYTLAKSKR